MNRRIYKDVWSIDNKIFYVKDNLSFNKLVIENLNKQKFSANNIFKGIKYCESFEIGQKINYEFPTVWSLTYDEANSFVIEQRNPVILQIKNVENIGAVLNQQNSLGNEQVLVCPIDLKIKEKLKHNSTTILIVEMINF